MYKTQGLKLTGNDLLDVWERICITVCSLQLQFVGRAVGCKKLSCASLTRGNVPVKHWSLVGADSADLNDLDNYNSTDKRNNLSVFELQSSVRVSKLLETAFLLFSSILLLLRLAGLLASHGLYTKMNTFAKQVTGT